jgi:DNA-binding NarL/FixJ family response regulator
VTQTQVQSQIRVLIADDQALVRGGFRLMLEQNSDITVCGEAADGVEAVRRAGELLPDVILMDIRMPNLDGIAATERLVHAGLGRVLVLTTFDVDDYVVDALRAGASGYLLKDVEPDDLVTAVRAVADGDLPLSPTVLRRVVAGFVGAARRPVDDRLDRLSDREREVLVLLGQGLTNAEICHHLVVSMPTTKTHVANVLAKLVLRDRVQAAIFAHRNGLQQ